MNTQNIIEQTTIGILSGGALWGIGWLLKELKRVLNASIKNEMLKINRKNIKYFWPAILSFIVFVWEMWVSRPYTIIPLIDFIFIFLALSCIMFNICLVFLIGAQEVRTNEIVKRYRAFEKKYTESVKLLKQNNRQVRMIVEERPDLFPEDFKNKLFALHKQADDISEDPLKENPIKKE